MKKILCLFVLTLTVSLIGCSDSNRNLIVPPNPDSSRSLEVQEEKEYTEDDAWQVFMKDKAASDYGRNDSVLINDEKMPDLKAIISYTDNKKSNMCNLAFVFENGTTQEICFALNEKDGVKDYEILAENTLNYVGTGTVTTSVRNIKTDEILDFSISYSTDKTDSNFMVESKKHTSE